MAETVWVVQQINWEYNDAWYDPDDDLPVKAFRRREDADRYQQAREAETRAAVVEAEPGQWGHDLGHTFGGFEHMTSLAPLEFNERLKQLGLPQLELEQQSDGSYHSFDWGNEWWLGIWERLPPERHDALWDLLDRLRFFVVAEVEVKP